MTRILIVTAGLFILAACSDQSGPTGQGSATNQTEEWKEEIRDRGS